MEGFSPGPHIAEVSGKFIMFAASVEKAHAGKAGPCGVAGGKASKGDGFAKGGKAASKGAKSGKAPMWSEDPITAFIRHWNLNEDGQAKMWRLSPEVQQTVMASFSPPPNLTDVNGKFIMFASS